MCQHVEVVRESVAAYLVHVARLRSLNMKEVLVESDETRKFCERAELALSGQTSDEEVLIRLWVLLAWVRSESPNAGTARVLRLQLSQRCGLPEACAA